MYSSLAHLRTVLGVTTWPVTLLYEISHNTPMKPIKVQVGLLTSPFGSQLASLHLL